MFQLPLYTQAIEPTLCESVVVLYVLCFYTLLCSFCPLLCCLYTLYCCVSPLTAVLLLCTVVLCLHIVVCTGKLVEYDADLADRKTKGGAICAPDPEEIIHHAEECGDEWTHLFCFHDGIWRPAVVKELRADFSHRLLCRVGMQIQHIDVSAATIYAGNRTHLV